MLVSCGCVDSVADLAGISKGIVALDEWFCNGTAASLLDGVL